MPGCEGQNNEEEVGKLKGTVVSGITAVPPIESHGTSDSRVVEPSVADPIGSTVSTDHRPEPSGAGGKVKSNWQGHGSGAQGTGRTSSDSSTLDDVTGRGALAKHMAMICSLELPPDDPCVAFLRERGMDLDAADGLETIAGISPLGGKRWYLSCRVRGRPVDFLIDTGASHTMISRDICRSIVVKSDDLFKGITANTASGSAMQTYGRLVLPLQTGDRNYVFSPVVAELADDGILGLDFAAFYGLTLDPRSGKATIEWPQKSVVQCVLKRVSSVASVAQTCRIPAGHVCNVLVTSEGLERNRMGIVEPDIKFLAKRGVYSDATLVQNVHRAVIPVCNPLNWDVRLEKGMVVGGIQYADRIGEWDSPEVEEALSRLESGHADRLEAGIEGVSAGDTAQKLPTYLSEMFHDTHLELQEDKDKLSALLSRHLSSFKSPDETLGRTDRVLHRIDVGNAQPIRTPYRRMPLSKKLEADRQLEEMLGAGIVRNSLSPWSSPVQMVTKKDGTMRFCVDYRGLNGVTKKNAYPIPRVDECLDALGGNKWFSCLDLQSGYWQIGMHPDDVEKTAFSYQRGLFEFDRMAFGLCNAPATFERMMEDMLRGLLGKVCLVYLDDIIIFGKTTEEAMSNLGVVLDRIENYGLKLKPGKCKLFRRSVEYLGRIVSEDGVKANPGKIDAVMTWSRPQSAKEVRSFIGFCSYYRDFIPGFAELVSPLQDLIILKPKSSRGRYGTFSWSEKAEKAFNALKLKFQETPVLRYPTVEGRFILDTDASNTSIGAALSQMQEGVEVPISFASNTLSKTQRNYCTTKRELLAVVVYTRKFRHYLCGGDFTIRTDHSSLKWLLNFKEAEGMMGRWLAHLSEFGLSNTHMEHRSGAKHLNADGLSRIPVRLCQRLDCTDCGAHKAVIAGVNGIDDPLSEGVVFWSLNELLDAQIQDRSIKKVAEWVVAGAKPVRPALSLESAEIRKLVGQWPLLTFRQGLLCRWKVTAGRSRRSIQVVVPAKLRAEVLAYCHGHRTAAHFGRKRTLEKVKRRYYWPGMGKDISRWVKHCPTCCLVKPGEGVGKAELHQEMFGVRFGRIAMDIVSGFKTTPKGNTCMLVIQDYFTKYVRVVPLPDHTAVTCAEAFVDNWVLTFGIPLLLHSDQGREFESRLFTEMCDYLTIAKQRTNPYRPQSDGQVERFNRTLIQTLTMLVDSHMDDWDEQSKYVVSAYNGSEHASTGCSPNMMVFGDEVLMPADVVFGAVDNALEVPCAVTFVENLRDRLREGYDLVRKNLQKAAERQKVGYDTGLKQRRYSVGEQVVRYHTPQAAIKLAPNWDGPFTIDTVVSESTVILRSARGRLYKSNVDRIRRWYGVELSQTVELLQPQYNDDALEPCLTDTGVKARLNDNVFVGEECTTQRKQLSTTKPAKQCRARQNVARIEKGVEVLDALPQPRKRRGRPPKKAVSVKTTKPQSGSDRAESAVSRKVLQPDSTPSRVRSAKPTEVLKPPDCRTKGNRARSTPHCPESNQVLPKTTARRGKPSSASKVPPVVEPRTIDPSRGAKAKSSVVPALPGGGKKSPRSVYATTRLRQRGVDASQPPIVQSTTAPPEPAMRMSARLAAKQANTQ